MDALRASDRELDETEELDAAINALEADIGRYRRLFLRGRPADVEGARRTR